jgi:hypothetical protein
MSNKIQGEFYNMEFPKTINDIVYLGRQIRPNEIELADKETLRELCIQLKQKEIEYYTKYYDLLNKLEEKGISIDNIVSL